MYKLPYTGAEIEERLAKLDNLNAENFLLSEETADLYGLSGVDANVDKALGFLPIAKFYGKHIALSGASGSGLASFSTLINDDFGVMNLATYPTRIIVPPTAKKVRLIVSFPTLASDGDFYCHIYKNGSLLLSNIWKVNGTRDLILQSNVSIVTLPISVVSGDYLQIFQNATIVTSCVLEVLS